jgi:SulP family sulfate permease
VFVPILFSTLRGYDRRQFTSDAVAGVIVGIVALPLAIAFAIASGVTPDRGLWTAIVAGFIISAFGGSRVQIGGPTGAFVVIVYGIVQKFGIDGLTVATLMAGVILVVMGFAKFGDAIKFIPHPLVTGFTSGIAIIILSGQVKDFFGLQMGSVPANFLAKWQAYAQAAGSVSPAAVGVAVLALAIILLWPRISTRIPGPFVALIVTTAAVSLLHIPWRRSARVSARSPPRFPRRVCRTWASSRRRASSGRRSPSPSSPPSNRFLSAVVADGMIGTQHKSNVELVAQGVANIASPMSVAFLQLEPLPARRPTSRTEDAHRSRASCTRSHCCSLRSSSASGRRSYPWPRSRPSSSSSPTI